MKYLNPIRFYHTVGKRAFISFVLLTIFLFFFYGPLINMLMLAFANKYQYPNALPQEFGIKWWIYIFKRDDLVVSVINSFVISGLTTVASLFLCIPAAYALARYEFFGKKAITFSYLLTNAFPKIGIYVSIGIIYYRLNLMGTYIGVILIDIINTMMFMVWLPMGSFRSIHKEQEEAARDCGAGKFDVFRKVTLPLAMPGIAVASVFSFLGALEEATGTLMLGFPKVKTMTTQMYGVIMDFPSSAGAVYAVLMIVPSLLIIFLFRKYISAEAIQKR